MRLGGCLDGPLYTGGISVGQSIMAAAAFSGGSYLHVAYERGRLKAGCGQNCPPHKCNQLFG
jgi:hypothetical protein